MESDCSVQEKEKYDLGFHIGSLFIIMTCSFLGTILPIVGKKFPKFKVRATPFYCMKMFGSGVILSTSLVHMFTPAYQNLTHPCLPSEFTEDFTALAGAFALFAILSMQLIQLLVSKVLQKSNSHPNNFRQEEGENHDHHHHTLFLQRERHVATYILELGIASHSIIIGLAIGVARGSEFRSLFVALVFHQFFEGIALSSVVLDSDFRRRRAAIFAVAFYSLTTPFGVAIGIGVNRSFNENSIANLVSQGVLDALSAGILLYDGLVNIVTPHLKSEMFEKSSTISQVLQLVFLWFGAGIVTLIGRWA